MLGGFIYVYTVPALHVSWEGPHPPPPGWDDLVVVKVGRTKDPLDRFQTERSGFKSVFTLGIPYRGRLEPFDAEYQWQRFHNDLHISKPSYAAGFPDLVAVIPVPKTHGTSEAEVRDAVVFSVACKHLNAQNHVAAKLGSLLGDVANKENKLHPDDKMLTKPVFVACSFATELVLARRSHIDIVRTKFFAVLASTPEASHNVSAIGSTYSGKMASEVLLEDEKRPVLPAVWFVRHRAALPHTEPVRPPRTVTPRTSSPTHGVPPSPIAFGLSFAGEGAARKEDPDTSKSRNEEKAVIVTSCALRFRRLGFPPSQDDHCRTRRG